MPPLPASVGSRICPWRLSVVQRVVEAGDHARGIAERRTRGDVLHALAVDVDGAIVAQRFQGIRAGLLRQTLTLPVCSGGIACAR